MSSPTHSPTVGDAQTTRGIQSKSACVGVGDCKRVVLRVGGCFIGGTGVGVWDG